MAVVIVTYESSRVIRGCLEALREAAEGVELVSVVVVDNGSQDDSVAEALSAWPGLVVVQSTNLGYAAGINRGHAVSAEHDMLLALNADASMARGSLAELARALMDEQVAMAVPRINQPNGELAPSLRRWPTFGTALAEAVLGGWAAAKLNLGETIRARHLYEHPHDVDWATGAAVMIDASCWEQLGNWDESFFMYSEETEYMQRAAWARRAVRFVPSAICTHKGSDSGSSPGLWALLQGNKVRLFARTHGALHTRAFKGAIMAGQGLRSLMGDARAVAAVKHLRTLSRHETATPDTEPTP